MTALSQKEKKRRSRASKGAKYHDMERERSRKRMAIFRAKNKAQKRAALLRSVLREEDRKEVENHVARKRQDLVTDWFNYHGLKFDPKRLSDPKMLGPFMTKIEMHKIELQVAEFEISIIEDRDADDDMDDGGLGFVPAARLALDRRPGDDPAPKSRPRAKGRPKPAVVPGADRPVQSKSSAGTGSSSLPSAETNLSPPEAMPGSGRKPEPAPPAPTSNKQEVLCNDDIDRLVARAAPVVTDAEEGSADGEAPASPAFPVAATKALSSHILPALPSFTEGRYAAEIVKSDEGIHSTMAEAMDLCAAAPAVAKAEVRRRTKEKEENKVVDDMVERAVAAAMAHLSRGGPLRRRTVAPPPGVEGPVRSVEGLRPRPAGGTAGPCKSEEAPENRDLVEAMRPPENQDVLEALQLFEGGLPGDATLEQGGEGALETQVPQDELLRMDMECYDIGDDGLNGVENSASRAGRIEVETFDAEAFLW